ncbi:hypothetical protein [Demequina aurantiaca]|uniref:hypothetical protein n=1 Tax=Demequina aurantiaca TaxID=676200 RepID=UPI003D324E63
MNDPDDTPGHCAEASLLAMLPAGSSIQEFQCALGSPYQWAAVVESSTSEVYFMRSNGPWELVETGDACESGEGQAPEELLSMCPEP